MTSNQDYQDSSYAIGQPSDRQEPESYYANAYAVASQGPGMSPADKLKQMSGVVFGDQPNVEAGIFSSKAVLASPKANECSESRHGDTEMRDYEKQMSQIKKNLAIFNIEVENLSTSKESNRVNEFEASKIMNPLNESKMSKKESTKRPKTGQVRGMSRQTSRDRLLSSKGGLKSSRSSYKMLNSLGRQPSEQKKRAVSV